MAARGVPQAYICHKTPQRLRIKITSRRGDSGYFENLQAALTRHRAFDRVEVNRLTGSVLIVDDHLDVDDIAALAESRGLFVLPAPRDSRSPMTIQLVSHLDNLNTTIRRLTTGEMDLAGALLLLLLLSGLYQLFRGNLQMPPWYTTFWYAFGIYKLASVIKDLPQEK
jgi:hypothetical protein